MPNADTRLQRMASTLRVASRETLHTKSGKPYSVDYSQFIKFMNRVMHLRGDKSGPYLRDEIPVPDKYLETLRDDFGARGKGIPPNGGSDITSLWGKLVAAVQREGTSQGSSAIESLAAGHPGKTQSEVASMASDDVGDDIEYALHGTRAGKLWKVFFETLATGSYQNSTSKHESWDINERKTLLEEIFGDAFYDGAVRSKRFSLAYRQAKTQMTVGKLIAKLRKYPSNMNVVLFADGKVYPALEVQNLQTVDEDLPSLVEIGGGWAELDT